MRTDRGGKMCQIVEEHNMLYPKIVGARVALFTNFQKSGGGQGPPGPPVLPPLSLKDDERNVDNS